MTITLGLDDGPYLSALREIIAVHADLRHEHRSLSDSMRMLLHGGWTGVAAEEFHDGWSVWEDGLTRVLDGLAAMSEVMVSVSSGLHACDDTQSSTLAHVRHRLGDAS